MFKDTKVFSGFSVDTIEKAKAFYSQILGLEVEELSQPMPMLILHLATGADVLVYPKGNAHVPASFTILSFPVDDIDVAIDQMTQRGVEFINLGNHDIPQDEKRVMRGLTAGMGPDIAWFNDRARNNLAVLQDEK